ncbi:MAG: patatin-like phospholipase family protein [Myxococcota bacterium]
MESRLAVVLSGGGARGAYEAGVLSWILEDAARRRAPLAIRAVCGTSVGAIHAAWLASAVHEPEAAARRLDEVWRSLQLDRVLRFRLRQGLGSWRILAGGSHGVGLFDPRALARLVGDTIDWRRVRQNLAEGVVGALTVTATHLPTGRPTMFLDAPPEHGLTAGTGGRVITRREAIGLAHVMASASIPVVFPPVSVGGELYCDGGLRLNTPLGPAIRLGADRVLVVGLHAVRDAAPELGPGRYPGASFLLGKVLNAFLLDHVAQDLENLERVNELLGDAMVACGPDAVARMSEAAASRGRPVHRPIQALTVRPSVPLSEIAAQQIRSLSWVGRGAATAAMLRATGLGEGTAGDLASYLLFDGGYAAELLDLGRRDAAARADEIRAFLAPEVPA